jgi:hypothetical protein
VTGRAADGDSDWDGPEWAAPERAERLASRPVTRPRVSGMFGQLCKAMAAGLISPEGFREVIQIKISFEQEERA